MTHPDVPAEPGEDGPSPLLLVLSIGVSVVILGGALAAPLLARVFGHEAAVPDLSAVRLHDVTDRFHREGDIDYPQTPPVGGDHAAVWLECGVYDVPVRDENAVHDLEHGTVWITHDPDLPTNEVERLAAQLPDNGIMSPYPGLPAPAVVTVWGAQLHLDGGRDPRLELFLEEYGDGHTAPEIGVTCHGGTPNPDGSVDGPAVGA